MKITYLGHASFLVDCGTDRILCDPWLSPFGAYAASWFPFPPNDSTIPESLEVATHLYISHWHQDHLDEWFLRGRSKAWKQSVTVLLPRFKYPKLKNILNSCGYTNIVEVEEEYRTNHGTHIYIQTDENPLFSDSSITIESLGAVFVNANDCKLSIGQEGEIVRRFGPVTYLAAQFSGATFHPTCYDYPDDEKQTISRERRHAKFQRIISSMERLRAKAYIPSAGPACFLTEDLFQLNLNPATVFSTNADFAEWLENSQTSRDWKFLEMIPGDILEDPHVTEKQTRFDLDDLKTYARKQQPYIAEELARFEASTENLLFRTKEHFQELLLNVPELGRTANVTLKVTISGDNGGSFYVNTFKGDIYDNERVAFNQHYEITLDEFWMSAILAHKINWEDLILSFRFRIHREPDVYNEAFIAFLHLESTAEREDYLDHLAKLSATDRERIQREHNGELIEYDRYCPHNCEDLTEAKIENGVLTCPRHFWRFSMDDGGGLNNTCSLHVMHLAFPLPKL